MRTNDRLWLNRYSNRKISVAVDERRRRHPNLLMTETAYIALGSNLDNPQQQVLRAIIELEALPDTHVTAVSPWYSSPPMGPADQPDYINGVAKLETTLPPLPLLKALQGIESTHHRVKLEHWGPRTLDLDILLYGNQVIDLPELRIPHAEMATRNFVLFPLADIAPQLVLPDGISLAELLESCPPEGIVRHSQGGIRGTTG